MKLFRGSLVVFTLLTLCLLVSAEKIISTEATFYGECQLKKRSTWGAIKAVAVAAGMCRKDGECVPKESGCKGECACDLTGLNECKCRGLFGNGLREKAIHLFFEKDTDLEVGKALGAFVAGITNGKNDIAKQFDNEQCRDEFKSLKEDIQLDMKAMNLKFRKALNLAEDRKSEETAFLKSFEGKAALIELQERYKRLVQKILNVLQKGLFVASKCGVEEKSIKLLGVTSAALMMKESYLAGKHSDEATKGDITKTTRNILEYLPVAAKELPEELSKEAYFKVLGNVVRHIVAGKRGAAVNSETLFRKFGFPEEPRNSLVKDVEMLLSSEGSLVTFESNQDMFKVKKKTYKSIGFKLHTEILVIEGKRKLKKWIKRAWEGVKDLGKWFKDKLGKKSKFQPGTPEHPFKNRAFNPSRDIECVDKECDPTNSIEVKGSKSILKSQTNLLQTSSLRASSPRASSPSFLEMTSSFTGECNGVAAADVLAGIDTSCKSDYDFDFESNPNLLDCLVFVAENGEKVTLTRGKDNLWLKGEAETVKYEIACGGGRRRLLQIGGQSGSC
jgi:hypothetical protein